MCIMVGGFQLDVSGLYPYYFFHPCQIHQRAELMYVSHQQLPHIGWVVDFGTGEVDRAHGRG